MLIPVVDVFAGPGGLGEGFSSLSADGRNGFQLALSIEKDHFAHQTLLFRSFFRQLKVCEPKAAESALLSGLEPPALVEKYPRLAGRAAVESICLELSLETASTARDLVKDAISRKELWVLIGGPPCQAYSLIGRARNRGIEGYSPEADKRQTLYVEYLQILADHAPAAFIMENVKGLLSAQLSNDKIFDRIREDLCNPAAAIRREGRNKPDKAPKYKILSLTTEKLPDELEARDFVVRCEDFGIPQARHRVILLGVREDFWMRKAALLKEQSGPLVGDSLKGLPRIRSGLSKIPDSAEAWSSVLRHIWKRPWLKEIDTDIRTIVEATLDHDDRFPLARGAEFIAQDYAAADGDGGSRPVYNHMARSHIPADLERYMFASCFAKARGASPSLSALPKSLLPRHKNAIATDRTTPFQDRFRVQLATQPASTVTAHIAKDGHYYIHYDPTQCRSLTVREAATLQTFPPDYVFLGPRTSQYQQVGNAVPPKLAEQIARIVYKVLT